MEKKIKFNKDFLWKLHQLIYENSNTLIGIDIDKECKIFIKKIESLNFNDNNN